MMKALEKGQEIWSIECNELHRSGSLTAVARKLARHKLDVVGVQEVRWDRRHCKNRGLCFYLWKKQPKGSTGNRIFYTTEQYQQLKK
jgi:hypothetical protein